MKRSLTRYGLNSLLFGVLGPASFWLLFPLGAIPAWLIAEGSCQVLRFFSIRYLVFPASLGYRVSVGRYLLALAPSSLTGLTLVATLRNSLDRNLLTLTGTAASFAIGFLFSRMLYGQEGQVSTRIGASARMRNGK